MGDVLLDSGWKRRWQSAWKSQVCISKLVLLRRNEGNDAKDNDVSREIQGTFESVLPGLDLRLCYKSHQEGRIGQLNTTANHKIQRISIICTASDILKPIIFCICRLLACSVHSAFPWSQARDDKNPVAEHPRFQGNWSQEPLLQIQCRSEKPEKNRVKMNRAPDKHPHLLLRASDSREASARPPEHNLSSLLSLTLRYANHKGNSSQLCRPIDLCRQQTRGLFLLASGFVKGNFLTLIW